MRACETTRRSLPDWGLFIRCLLDLWPVADQELWDVVFFQIFVGFTKLTRCVAGRPSGSSIPCGYHIVIPTGRSIRGRIFHISNACLVLDAQ